MGANDDAAASGWGTLVLLLAVLEARSGEERKLEMRSSYSSDIAAALEEDEVASCFDCGTSRLKLSPLEGGADREEVFLLPICAWLRTEEVLAGCTGGTDGVFKSSGRRRRSTEIPGSFSIFT